MEINKKKLVLFMPSMDGGGVEKNLIIVSNFLSKYIKNILLISFDKKFKNRFSKNIKFICPNKKKGNYTKYQKYFYCIFLLIKLIIKERKITIFAFQANIYCIIIAKIFSKKIIVRSNSSPDGWSKNIFKNLIFKFFFKYSDFIIVNSKNFKKKIDKLFNVKSVFIYNPLNKNEIIKKSKIKLNKLPYAKNDGLKIINVARFTDQKNHLLLLNSLNDIKYKLKFKLLLIGYGQNEKVIRNFIKSARLEKRVTIKNFKNNPYNYMRAADLFILTSDFEGLPNVLLEAMCLKKIIIATDWPTGPREILQNGKLGTLIKVNDRKILSKKILEIAKNKNKYQSIAKKAFKNLDDFSYRENLNKYLNIVKRAIK